MWAIVKIDKRNRGRIHNVTVQTFHSHDQAMAVYRVLESDVNEDVFLVETESEFAKPTNLKPINKVVILDTNYENSTFVFAVADMDFMDWFKEHFFVTGVVHIEELGPNPFTFVCYVNPAYDVNQVLREIDNYNR